MGLGVGARPFTINFSIRFQFLKHMNVLTIQKVESNNKFIKKKIVASTVYFYDMALIQDAELPLHTESKPVCNYTLKKNPDFQVFSTLATSYNPYLSVVNEMILLHYLSLYTQQESLSRGVGGCPSKLVIFSQMYVPSLVRKLTK